MRRRVKGDLGRAVGALGDAGLFDFLRGQLIVQRLAEIELADGGGVVFLHRGHVPAMVAGQRAVCPDQTGNPPRIAGRESGASPRALGAVEGFAT